MIEFIFDSLKIFTNFLALISLLFTERWNVKPNGSYIGVQLDYSVQQNGYSTINP